VRRVDHETNGARSVRRGKVKSFLVCAGLPYIRLIPKVTAVAGETLRLKCPVAGYPIEEIRWERGGRELPDDLRQKVMPDGTLIVSSVQKQVDSGAYTCWAKNKQGHSARRSGEVAVIGEPQKNPRDPVRTFQCLSPITSVR
jgi:hypothetical protein